MGQEEVQSPLTTGVELKAAGNVDRQTFVHRPAQGRIRIFPRLLCARFYQIKGTPCVQETRHPVNSVLAGKLAGVANCERIPVRPISRQFNTTLLLTGNTRKTAGRPVPSRELPVISGANVKCTFGDDGVRSSRGGLTQTPVQD